MPVWLTFRFMRMNPCSPLCPKPVSHTSGQQLPCAILRDGKRKGFGDIPGWTPTAAAYEGHTAAQTERPDWNISHSSTTMTKPQSVRAAPQTRSGRSRGLAPVLYGVTVGVVAHQKHAMIELRSTRRVKHSALIVLESWLVRLDRY